MAEHKAREATRQDERDLHILRTLHADDVAFETLYRQFYPRLFDFVMRILGRPEDVEETINDTMMVVWNKSDDFAGRSKVSTWIFGIAYKKALKRLKSNKRLAERELQLEVDGEGDERLDPFAAVSDQVLFDRIRSAVAALPMAQRSIVHLSFFYGYTYAEIADIVDCPVNTVKTRMFYARERLRPVLDDAVTRERTDASR